MKEMTPEQALELLKHIAEDAAQWNKELLRQMDLAIIRMRDTIAADLLSRGKL